MSLESFSKRINELMREEGVSARVLADVLGVQRKSIFLWRSGRYYPKYDALIKLIYHFEVSAGYLLGISDNPECKINKESHVNCERKFKARLVKYMEDKSITKYKMSKQLGVGQTVFARWINKDAMPDVSNLIKLSYLMNERIEFLLGIED